MLLLSVSQLRKYYGPDPVLEAVTFDVYRGERVALVGPNGCGKTTLLRILAGHDEADAGRCQWAPSNRIGYLEQHPTFQGGRSVWDEAREALADATALAAEAERVAHELAAATSDVERERLGKQFDHLQHELAHRDAYHIDHKIDRVLSGLGFASSSYQQTVTTLSGGQQNRLLLAQLLLAQPDCMLLDEPSNHLDIAATQWLENHLVESATTLIIVSHDRYLLDKVATCTLELLRGEVESFAGNYSAYKRQKADRLELQRRTYEKQQTEIARMEDFVRRNHYGQKHAQAEDRRKKLERLERVPPPREITAPVMGFPAASRCGDIVLRVEGLAKGFDRPLFTDVTLDILRGQKWGILGPNGVGKTTLLKCLLGLLEADQGRVNRGAGVRIGYFDQLLACLPAETSVLEAIRPAHKEFVEQQRRNLLARFGIIGDQVWQPVASLSGGERNRAALAMLSASDANVLVLDEPTNHLDLWARDSLERSLKQFDGTVLFVSHDRYFVNQVADHLLVLEPSRCWVVDGDYETYLRLKELQRTSPATAAQSAPRNNQSSSSRNNSDPRPKSQWRFPYRKVSDVERDIAGCEQEIQELHQQLADPAVHRDGLRVKQLADELAAAEARLGQLYEHLEEALRR